MLGCGALCTSCADRGSGRANKVKVDMIWNCDAPNADAGIMNSALHGKCQVLPVADSGLD